MIPPREFQVSCLLQCAPSKLFFFFSLFSFFPFSFSFSHFCGEWVSLKQGSSREFHSSILWYVVDKFAKLKNGMSGWRKGCRGWKLVSRIQSAMGRWTARALWLLEHQWTICCFFFPPWQSTEQIRYSGYLCLGKSIRSNCSLEVWKRLYVRLGARSAKKRDLGESSQLDEGLWYDGFLSGNWKKVFVVCWGGGRFVGEKRTYVDESRNVFWMIW